MEGQRKERRGGGGWTKEWIITKMLREMQERMKSNIKDKYMGKSKDKTIACGRRRGRDVSREQHRNMYTVKGETDYRPRLDA